MITGVQVELEKIIVETFLTETKTQVREKMQHSIKRHEFMDLFDFITCMS